MLCYKDKAFCGSDCVNHECHRYISESVKDGARKWWGGDDYPLAVSDFSNDCEFYEAPKLHPAGSSK